MEPHIVQKDHAEKLSILIQEHLRIDGSKKSARYLDINNNVNSFLAGTNHVIFGRRGTGKSALIAEALNKKTEGYVLIKVDCENLKDHSFPNVIIEILDQVFSDLNSQLTVIGKIRYLLTWFRTKRIIKILRSLKTIADIQESEETNEEALKAKLNSGTTGVEASQKSTTKMSKRLDKLDDILKKLPEWKKIAAQHAKINNRVKVILIMDDFYQLPISRQASIADVIHRLCKGIDFNFKIATIPHRSELYKEINLKPIGIQAGHDYYDINVDFSLEKFNNTSDTLKKILCGFAEAAGYEENTFMKEFFQGEGFNRLVLASGGVPRDFLSLFSNHLNKNLSVEKRQLGKDAVRELANSYHSKKKDDLKKDSDKSEVESISKLFEDLKQFTIEESGKNCFLLNRNQESLHPVRYKQIQRLADFRLIHRVSSAISSPAHPGESFDAYIIDLGAYSHIRKMKGRVSEVDLVDTTRTGKDTLRTSPICDLEKMNSSGNRSSGLTSP